MSKLTVQYSWMMEGVRVVHSTHTDHPTNLFGADFHKALEDCPEEATGFTINIVMEDDTREGLELTTETGEAPE